MLRKRRLGSSLLIAVLAVSLVASAGPAVAGPAPAMPGKAGAEAAATPDQAGKPRTITLITGDKVTVHKGEKITVEPGKGRRGVQFLTHQIRGHQYVMPSDALPLVRAGKVDRRLFDVTALLDYRFDQRRYLPLIVVPDRAAGAAATSTLTAEGATVTRELPAIGGLAVRAKTDRVGELWQSLTPGGAGARALGGGVSKVYVDAIRKPSLDVSVPQIGAPTAWAAGYDGKGVTVAVLDTGIDRAHPDLSGQVTAGQNFTEGEEDDLDRAGHGTHVASTIAGTGAASSGKYQGVAPGAKLLDGKVCVQFGCAESWILAGMQWAADQGASVVNMSLGGFDTPEVDPVEEAVDKLTEDADMLFVIAAGNAGADASISSPASADAALAVGAVDKKDALAVFSSRGPRIDGALKPDITGPGVEIVAAKSKDAGLGDPGEPYFSASGTSMATPHVAGAAAILAQRHPDSDPALLKATLMGSAKPNPALGAFAQGAGRVDVARAINQTVLANPPSASFGRQLWPHTDDAPVTRTITYRNSGSAAVTLNLAMQATGPTGRPAPARMFALSASTVTVPAGGQASVTVTADTRVSGPDGFYTGRVTATAGDVVITTPFAVDREVESYDVDLRHLDRAGKLTGNVFTLLFRTDASGAVEVFDEDGAATVRVPKGRYALFSFVNEGGEERPVTSLLARPRLDVTADRSLAVDARKGRPLSVTLPVADATPVLSEVAAIINTGESGASFGVLGAGFDGIYTGQLGPSGRVPGFFTKVGETRAKVGADGEVLNSPFAYNLAWFVEGRLVTGFTKRVALRNLATVKRSYARQGPVDGAATNFALLPGKVEGGFAVVLPFTLPFNRTDYVSTEGGVHWESIFDESLPGEEFPEFASVLFGPRIGYKAGRTYSEAWNKAVFGPSMADPLFFGEWVSRVGDTMFVLAPLFSDQASRAGFSRFDSASVKIFRNGAKVAEAAEAFAVVEVPRAAGRYRVEMQVKRGAPHRLSTQVDVAWTFRSGHVRGEEPARLPVSTVRFAPPVDANNVVPAVGKRLTIPVTVERQPGSAAKPAKALTVEVSFDDGRTWRKAKLTKHGSGWRIQIRHPNQAGFVSLRAAATDRAGNTVEQTILRAYEFK